MERMKGGEWEGKKEKGRESSLFANAMVEIAAGDPWRSVSGTVAAVEVALGLWTLGSGGRYLTGAVGEQPTGNVEGERAVERGS